MKIGARKLAEVLGVSPSDIPNLKQAGMPSEGARFSPVHCLAWFVRHQRSLLDRTSTAATDADRDALHGERRRLVRAQAERAEAELKAATRELLSTEEIIRVCGANISVVRSLILSMPTALSHRIGAASEEEIRAILREGAEKILSNLRSTVKTIMEEPEGNASTSR